MLDRDRFQRGNEREVSWLDWTTQRDISPDGKRITFDESGAGAGESTPFYIRDTDGSPAEKIGDGANAVFFPDGRLQVEIAPGDQAGVALGAVRVTPDGKSYAYIADQGLAVLHVIDGLK